MIQLFNDKMKVIKGIIGKIDDINARVNVISILNSNKTKTKEEMSVKFDELRKDVELLEDEYLVEEWYELLSRTEIHLKEKDYSNINIEIVKALKAYGQKSFEKSLKEVGIDYLRALESRDRLVLPSSMLSFLLSYIDTMNPNNALDLYISIVSPIIYSSIKKIMCTGYKHEYEYVKNFDKDISYYKEVSEVKGHKFDLVTCFAPLGIKRDTITLNGKKFRIEKNMRLVNESVNYLNKDGKVIALLTDHNLNETKPNGFFECIGLYPEAVICLEAGTFDPVTAVNTNIVVFSKSVHKKVFVAEITRIQKNNAQILNNFLENNSPKNARNGVWVDWENINTINKVIEASEIDIAFRRLPFKYINIESITNSIRKLKINDENISHENVVFIPSLGNKDVVYKENDITGRMDNYFELVLESKKVNSEYFARFLNTSLGKRVRSNISEGSFMPRINNNQILKCRIKLLPIELQEEIVDATNKLNNNKGQIERLKNELWQSVNSKKLKEIKKEMDQWEIDNGIELWIDTLPFPLASILWKYHSTSSNTKKVEHLFLFFESLSEFLCIILMSSYLASKEFYNKYKYKWLKNNNENRHWYKRASFGQWNMLYSKLSKVARELYNSNKRDYILNVLGNPSDEYLNIFNKELLSILNYTALLRNKWKGHGGATGPQEIKRRLEELEAYLEKTRLVLNDCFKQTHLIYPIDGRNYKGEYTNRVLYLNGTRTPFQEQNIIVNVLLDASELYLYHENECNPIQLHHWIKFEANASAFYFYTSTDSSKIRWVSYHYEKEPEIETEYFEKLLEPFQEKNEVE